MMHPKDDARCGGICLRTGALCKLSGALLDVSSSAASSGVVLVDSDYLMIPFLPYFTV